MNGVMYNVNEKRKESVTYGPTIRPEAQGIRVWISL